MTFSLSHFQLLRHFHSLPQPHHSTASHSSKGDNPSERRRAVRKNTGSTKNHLHMVEYSIIYIFTRSLHSFLSIAYYRAAFAVISLLSKATFTPSIQPNLGQPRTRLLLTSTINTLITKRYWVLIHSLQVTKPSQYSLIRYSLTPFLYQLLCSPLHS